MAETPKRPSKAERSSAAREAARKVYEQEQAAAKRKSLLVKLGVVGALVLIVALVIALVVQNRNAAIPDAGQIPSGGNEFGGIVLVSDGNGGVTTSSELPGGGTINSTTAGEMPEDTTQAATPRGVVDQEAPAEGEADKLTLFVDVNCVHCSEFEGQYGEQIQEWVANGEVELEYRNVAFLDGNSGTNYSSRGANALACVADQAPEAYLDFASAVFAHHSQGEMSNSELAEMAAENGAEGMESCIEGNTFRPFAKYTDLAAKADLVPGTPSVWINGQVWDPTADPDFVAWAEAQKSA